MCSHPWGLSGSTHCTDSIDASLTLSTFQFRSFWTTFLALMNIFLKLLGLNGQSTLVVGRLKTVKARSTDCASRVWSSLVDGNPDSADVPHIYRHDVFFILLFHSTMAYRIPIAGMASQPTKRPAVALTSYIIYIVFVSMQMFTSLVAGSASIRVLTHSDPTINQPYHGSLWTTLQYIALLSWSTLLLAPAQLIIPARQQFISAGILLMCVSAQ